MVVKADFEQQLREQFSRAARQNRPHVEINAGELHRVVGGYPSKGSQHHSIPSCCKAMRDEFNRGNAEIVFETPSGDGAAFTVRYHLPR